MVFHFGIEKDFQKGHTSLHSILKLFVLFVVDADSSS